MSWLDSATSLRHLVLSNAYRGQLGAKHASSLFDMQPQDLQRTAKLIGDLDGLVRALLAAAPSTKPGQRQLRADFVAADAALQVLRIAIAMDRPVDELVQASRQALEVLRNAKAHASSARVDLATRQAIQLAGRLAQEVLASFRAATVS